MEGPEFESKSDVFSSPNTCTPALRPAQSLLQLVPKFLPRLRRPKLDVDHSHPSSAEFEPVWSYTSIPSLHLPDVYLTSLVPEEFA